MQNQDNKPDYIYKTTVKATYGFTDKWIKMLGEPDKLVLNPHYRSGPPSSLYLRTRVEEFIDENRDAYEVDGRARKTSSSG